MLPHGPQPEFGLMQKGPPMTIAPSAHHAIKTTLMLAAVALPAPASAGDDQRDARTRLDYRVEPLADLIHFLRYHAAQNDGAGAPSELKDAVAATVKLQKKLGARNLAWEPLDQMLLRCTAPDEYLATCRLLPESTRLWTGETVALRDDAVALAKQLAAVWEHYREHFWPEHESAIRTRLAEIKKDFQPKEHECFAFMFDSLGINDPHDTVPVYLTYRGSWPGAFTIERGDGGGMCIVAVATESLAGSLLYEIILHETTHALDIVAKSDANVFQELRKKLSATGMPRRDRNRRNIPHTIMFIQAGETIRRIVDPAHKHYGDANTYYSRMGRIAEVEKRVWLKWLNRDISRAEAEDEIVSQLAPPDESAK
jgi:hypothetical protein